MNKSDRDLLVGISGIALLVWLLEKNKKACPRCNYPVTKEMFSCPNCGQPLQWGGI